MRRPEIGSEMGQAVADDDELWTRVRGVLDVPLHRFLGIELVDPERPAAGVRLQVADEAVNNAGVLHGGILAALLDVASYLAVLPSLALGENAVTHDISTSLMRSVPADSRLEVAGTVVRRGRSLVFLRAEATLGEAVVAIGQVTKSVVPVTG